MSEVEKRMEKIRVAAEDEIPEGGSRAVTAGARRIAVFRVGGRFYAVKDVCPHEASPLHGGAVRDGAVACPNHGYRFDLSGGACVSHPGYRVATYEVRVEGGDVYVVA